MTTTDQWQKPGEPALYPRGRLMNRGVRRAMTSAIVLLGVAWQLACSDSSQVPEVLASASLPMARAGASVRIDFTVAQAHLATRRRLMVALDFPQTRDGKLEDLILQQDLPVALNVALVQDGQLTPVPTQDNRAIIEPSQDRADGDVVNLHLYGHDGSTSSSLLAGFYPPQPGHYTATVRTVQDQPRFEGIQTTVRVSPFYNTGE